MQNKKVFIICWFGPFPAYFEVWKKTVTYNDDFDFFIFTDFSYNGSLPNNIFIKKLTLDELRQRATKVLAEKISLDKAYRVCDYRPMYGLIFSDYISDYDFWGYCDIDLAFGHIADFITEDMLNNNDAIFNAGHLTLIRNNNELNSLFKRKGALFSYKTVVKKDAIFAFDEFTGIQRIAKEQGIKAVYGIQFIDADSRHYQLKSRSAIKNPKHQAYYWENGSLYRTKIEGGRLFYQNIAYIHLQKRLLENIYSGDSFWVCPNGYTIKEYKGFPKKEDIIKQNPYMGESFEKREKIRYLLNKIKNLFSRNIYQIYVRIVQQKFGINSNDGSMEESDWYEYK